MRQLKPFSPLVHMDPNSPTFQKWLRGSLNDEFGATMDKWLDKEQDGYMVSQKIIQSKKMKQFMSSTKQAFKEQRATNSPNMSSTTRPQTSLSFLENDLFDDDWSLGKGNQQSFDEIVDEISPDKPDHVRLAGYEVLLKNDLGSLLGLGAWEQFLVHLDNAIADDSRPVFEAGLQMYTKLLGFLYPLHEKSNEIFVSLIHSYENLYHIKQLNDYVPTTTSGINFKLLLHEKLCRIMHLLVRHQEEVLQSARTVDKNMEEMVEHFFQFLSSSTSLSQSKCLSAFNIVSVLEPQAEWSSRWNHNFLSRRVFCHTLSKVPSLLQRVIGYVFKYLEHPPVTIPFSVVDDVNETYISGDSVEALTYLHSLNFLSQLYAYSNGRALLFEHLTDNCMSVNDFLINTLNCLNQAVGSEVSNGVYEAIRRSMIYAMDKPITLCDAKFFSAAINPLMRDGEKIWPHILDVLMFMLETVDGRAFLITEYQTKSASIQKRDIKYPAESIMLYTSNLLKQPLSVMNVEHVRDLFNVIEKMFDINEIYDIVGKVVQEHFCPAIKHFYGNVDKYFVENENKAQKFNKAARSMLLTVSSVPMMLQNIVNEPKTLRELVQDSIAPLRTYWNVNKVASFISNAAYFKSGFEVLCNLAPYILSTFIIELCKNSEEPMSFQDPWSGQNTSTFQHILSLFSLNTKCFMAFMKVGEEEEEDEEKHEYPVSLPDLYQNCLKPDSPYHYVSLLSVKCTIWNFDVYIFLMNLLDLQEEFLKMQESCIIEIEDNGETKEKYIVDNCSLMRHVILTDCHRLEHKTWEFEYNPENYNLFSKMPSLDEQPIGKESKTNSKTEIDELLEDDRPGLRDSGWVSEARRAFKNSGTTIMTVSVFNLLSQMQEAIPTVDWVEHFTWNTTVNDSNDTENYWLPEDFIGFDVVVHYAQVNKLPLVQVEPQDILKVFIKSTYEYIKYPKSKSFEYFDWFLSTVFIVCRGELEKCKTFMLNFIKFPSAMFIWPVLSTVVDQSNNEDSTTRMLFAQLLENIVGNEFAICSSALKQNCGTSWWMICNRLMSQCFWGILPWSEILNYLIICILYPPDYLLYYCASLLNHCQYVMLRNITNGKLWPDNLVLSDYKYHGQIGFMDQLGKRYRGKILPMLTQRKLKIAEST